MENEVEIEAEKPSSSSDGKKVYNKDVLLQRFVALMRSENADVQFVFEDEDDVVKLSAHKDILAASSPVFDAMFNGDLKEEGDVRIADFTPVAFEEFLQFFYGNQVNLTLDNIDEVLELIDKYDVADFFPICVDFLKTKLTTDDILWGLHLAIKFHLSNLKEYCTSQIQKHHETVFAMFTFDEYDNGKLRESSNKRLLKVDLDNIFPHIFAVSKDIISKMSDKIKRLQEKRNFFPINLSSGDCNTDPRLTNNETIIFSMNELMLLTDIFCSKIYTYNYNHREYEIATSIFEVLIEERPDFFGWDSKTLYTTQIVIDNGENHVKLLAPIVIKPNHFYAITFKSDIQSQGSFHTFTATIPDKAVSIAPGVNISFPQMERQYSYSLISQLYFAHLVDH